MFSPPNGVSKPKKKKLPKSLFLGLLILSILLVAVAQKNTVGLTRIIVNKARLPTLLGFSIAAGSPFSATVRNITQCESFSITMGTAVPNGNSFAPDSENPCLLVSEACHRPKPWNCVFVGPHVLVRIKYL